MNTFTKEWNIVVNSDFVIVQIVKDGKAIRSVTVDRHITAPMLPIQELVNDQPLIPEVFAPWNN